MQQGVCKMERLVEFAEFKNEIKRIERLIVCCQKLFLTADDYAYKYAARGNVGDLNRAIA